MWDGRVVRAIVAAARDDLLNERWARDFADKLRTRQVTMQSLMTTVSMDNFIVLYWHKGLAAIGFWHPAVRLVAIWSPLRQGKWVTAFYRDIRYLLSQEDSEVLWHPEAQRGS